MMFEGHGGLYTDMYQLTMAQAYFLDGKAAEPAVFDFFFRKIPFNGGYVVFAGLDDLLEFLADFRYSPDDLQYLKSLGFGGDFLEYLRGFRFRGTVLAAREGDIVFPLEPVARVEGRLLETQLVETAVLNILNFESLVATKASRLRLAAGDRILSDFGLRRAHSCGGVHASRAAIIGGFDSTSNVFAARRYSLRPSGTMAHSYIESHGDELAAFRSFAESHPDGCVLLVDTFDTLRSGVPNAIRVAREMERRGVRLAGIRLDSGDLAYFAKHARSMLDEAGLGYVKIVASNLLDENVVRSLLEQGAPIDMFGVGTRLVTGDPDGALDGVYKLSEVAGEPRLKVSENRAKTTLPGRKKIIRCADGEGLFRADVIALEDETDVPRMVHPFDPEKSLRLLEFRGTPLLVKVMENGDRTGSPETIESIASRARRRLTELPDEHKRFENPHIYKVGLSERLAALRDGLVRRFRKED
jgi:nicotinate phosphoribosyltransferase